MITLKRVKHYLVKPVWNVGVAIIVENYRFWGKTFPVTWRKIGIIEKAIWLFFFNQTIAIITVFEMLLFRIR